MEIAVHTDPGVLADLVVEWRALWERDPDASLFHTAEYARTAWETELGADRSLVVVTAREHGVLVGLASFTIDPDRTLRFLGNAEITDYLGPLGAVRDRPRLAASFVEAAWGTGGWERAQLMCLAEDAGWAPLLAKEAEAHARAVTLERHDVCPRIALTGTYDDYLAALPGKLRHEIKRKARRLEREAGAWAIRLSAPDELDRDLAVFFDMHRAAEGPKGKFMHEGMTLVFTRLARTFAERGWLRLAWLETDRPLAATLSFSERGIWSVYNSAYDHTRRDLGPGMVLMGETIRLAAEEGCDVLDFLRGDEPYKYRFGATDVGLDRILIER